jgi:hypothetical protein
LALDLVNKVDGYEKVLIEKGKVKGIDEALNLIKELSNG